MQPVGYMISTTLQVPLDGTHTNVSVLHRLQCSGDEVQQAQDEEGWLVHLYSGIGFDKG